MCPLCPLSLTRSSSHAAPWMQHAHCAGPTAADWSGQAQQQQAQPQHSALVEAGSLLNRLLDCAAEAVAFGTHLPDALQSLLARLFPAASSISLCRPAPGESAAASRPLCCSVVH